MTEFGGLEQEMLKVLVQLFEAKNLCIYSWLSKFFDDKVSFKWTPDSISSNYRIEIKHIELEESEILSKLKYFYFLYKRLEKTNLIDLDLSGNVDFKIEISSDCKTYNLESYPETILYNFLSELGNKPILVSNYLIGLVENDFKKL